MTSSVVLLVGRRKAATAAVRRLGYEPLVVADLDDHRARGRYTASPNEACVRARELLGDRRPAAVVAVVEGTVPAAAAIRADCGLPGLTRDAAVRCFDKLAMKRAASAAGVSCTQWCEVTADTTADELIDMLGLPVVVKVTASSGGRGVTIARDRVALAAAIRPGMLAERMIHGVEMSVETVLSGGRVLFRNHTRYLEPRWANVVPAQLSTADARAVDALADAAHAALGVDWGITHLELFLCETGPVFSEIAARPPGGWLMELMKLAYDVDLWEAVVRVELGEQPSLPVRAARHAGMWMLHPGPGVVTRIDGVDAARALPGVRSVRVTVEEGDVVSARAGSGQSVGEVIVVAAEHDECAHQLTAAHAAIDICVA